MFTAGQADQPAGPARAATPGAPVIEVDRGGKITWHGPGQLVGYPIVRLGEPVDVIAYVRAIEEALIRAVRDAGVTTTRVEGRSGVWVAGRSPGAGPQGRRDRDPGVPRGHHARFRAQLRLRPRLVQTASCRAASGTPGVTSLSAELGRPVAVTEHGRRRRAPPGRRARRGHLAAVGLAACRPRPACRRQRLPGRREAPGPRRLARPAGPGSRAARRPGPRPASPLSMSRTVTVPASSSWRP